jgi:hypothetical protein
MKKLLAIVFLSFLWCETSNGTVIWQEKYEDNINDCKLLERDPGKIYYRNLNWKEEEKNIKRKRKLDLLN